MSAINDIYKYQDENNLYTDHIIQPDKGMRCKQYYNN